MNLLSFEHEVAFNVIVGTMAFRIQKSSALTLTPEINIFSLLYGYTFFIQTKKRFDPTF